MKSSGSLLVFCLALAAHASSVWDSLTPPQPKNELLAYGLSVGGTLVPMYLAMTSQAQPNPRDDWFVTTAMITAVIGPSLGQFYSESWAQGVVGVAIRFVGIGLVKGGLSGGLSGEGQVVVGIAVVTGGALYSLVDTHFSVQRANEKFKMQHFGFSPELFPSNNGGLKPGLLAWAKF